MPPPMLVAPVVPMMLVQMFVSILVYRETGLEMAAAGKNFLSCGCPCIKLRELRNRLAGGGGVVPTRTRPNSAIAWREGAVLCQPELGRTPQSLGGRGRCCANQN
jgi:hypothetical protein